MPSSGMLRRVTIVVADVSEERIADSFHPDYGGDTFPRNVGFYKSVTSYKTAFFRGF
jgi:hypothetical protein